MSHRSETEKINCEWNAEAATALPSGKPPLKTSFSECFEANTVVKLHLEIADLDLQAAESLKRAA